MAASDSKATCRSMFVSLLKRPQGAGAVEYEGDAAGQDADALLHPKAFRSGSLGIGEQREGQPVVLLEVHVLLDRVTAHAVHARAEVRVNASY